MAFHLGCMRALHECGLLARVDVISSVSGGSVLAALYCSSSEPFDVFERRVRGILCQGLLGRIVLAALSWDGARALLSTAVALVVEGSAGFLRLLLASFNRSWSRKAAVRRLFRGIARRKKTRTDIFERALRSRGLFGSQLLQDLPPTRPSLVINSTDLRTQTAFRFTREQVGSWRHGRVVSRRFRLSEAVAASAAFPILLPAIDRNLSFVRDGVEHRQRVLLSDGGVYDNLGVQVFAASRPAKFSFAIEPVDVVIACVAEPGLPAGDDAPIFLIDRLQSAFATVHRQLHVSSFATLHAWLDAGTIKRLVMPYLGQDDSKLPPVPDLPAPRPLGALKDYPVDFSPMPSDASDSLIRRGYEQTRYLLHAYMGEDGLVWP